MNHALLRSDTWLNQQSYYEASVYRPEVTSALDQTIQADVLIVGAGYAGLSAAIELAQRGFQVVVLEADRIGSGASGRNGGQAIVGFASGQDEFVQQLGPAVAKQVWGMSLAAIELIDQRISQFNIDCDRERGYIYVADSARKAKALEAEMHNLQSQWGFTTDFVQGAAVQRLIQSSRYLAAAYESVSGHLHPLKYALGLARAAQSLGVRIFEHSAVTRLDRGSTVKAHTAKGVVQAQFAVLAGNCMLPAYGPAVAPELTPRIMPVGTYIIATEALSVDLCRQLIPSNAAVCDNNFVLDYFRFSADNRMLFGGRVSYSTRTPRHLAQIMQKRMAQIFPQLAQAKVEHVWGGFVDISMNRAPDFGRIADNVFYLQGFSGHGVAATGLAGQLVAQAIAGQAQQFDVFARLKHRAFPGGELLRTPSLVLGMLYHRLKDLI